MNLKLLWYDQRDGQGIAVDAKGNEYYIDDSVLQFDKTLLNTHNGKGVSRAGLFLTGTINESIKHCLCAKNVRLA